MTPKLPTELVKKYKDPKAFARVLTELWTTMNLFCPSCNSHLVSLPTSAATVDVICSNLNCLERIQVKSSKVRITTSVIGGAFAPTYKSIADYDHPSILLIFHDYNNIEEATLIHRSCITKAVFENRNPSTIKRNGRIIKGGRFNISYIPESVRVPLIKNGRLVSRKKIRDKWAKVSRLLRSKSTNRHWMLDVLWAIDKIGKDFRCRDVYIYRTQLSSLYANNNNINPQIRKQLKHLVNVELLEKLGRDRYRRVLF